MFISESIIPLTVFSHTVIETLFLSADEQKVLEEQARQPIPHVPQSSRGKPRYCKKCGQPKAGHQRSGCSNQAETADEGILF